MFRELQLGQGSVVIVDSGILSYLHLEDYQTMQSHIHGSLLSRSATPPAKHLAMAGVLRSFFERLDNKITDVNVSNLSVP